MDPLEIFYTGIVENAEKVGNCLHEGFSDRRINPNRKFFRINPERVRSILKLVEIEDTPNGRGEQKPSSRKLSFKFSCAGVPIGAELSYADDKTIKAQVIDDKYIKFEGKRKSLTQAARIVRMRRGENTSVGGPRPKRYKGEILTVRRDRLDAEARSPKT